jgi:hypothetical protein
MRERLCPSWSHQNVSSADFKDTVFADTGLRVVYTQAFEHPVDLYAVVHATAQSMDTAIGYSVLAYANHAVVPGIAKDSFEVSESAMISTMLVSGGQWQVHSFHTIYDRDYFKACLSGDSLYTFYCESPEPNYSISINASRGNSFGDGHGFFDQSFSGDQTTVRLFPEVSDTFSFVLSISSTDTCLTYRIRMEADTLPYKADTYEPDGAFASATLLAANDVSQHHTLHIPSDTDFFKIIVSKDSTYTCSLGATSGNIGAQIYDSKMVKTSTQSIYSHPAIHFSQETNDTVYLRMYPRSYDVAKYDIFLSASKNPFLPDSFERDTRVAPVAISGNDTLQRTFHFRGDSDFIYIKPLNPCYVRYSIKADSGIAISNSFYYNTMSTSANWTEYCSFNVDQPISSGIWSILSDSGLFIRSYPVERLGQYTITLNFVDSISSLDTFERDDRPSMADTMLADGATRRYSIWPSNDVDWILFRMAPDSIYSLSLNYNSSESGLRSKCFVFDNSGMYQFFKNVYFGNPDTLQEKSALSRIYGYRISSNDTYFGNILTSPIWYTIKITSRKREE